MGRILSGMRPTGPLHLGHYVGALNNWIDFQDKYECFFMVADWHALMSEYKESHHLKNYCSELVRDWLACGIDPKKSTIFIQSEVKEHLELFMIFSCFCPLGWLLRCPTYKEQIKNLKEKDITNYAFVGYPVLQAADILLYRADTVPVGEDQLAHLELTREIVRRFHSIVGKKIFPLPQAKLTNVSRLLGLDRRKMSKSYGNYISLSEENPIIEKKVLSMITDERRIKKTDPGHPEVCNVFSYHKVFNNKESSHIEGLCKEAKIGCVECKKRLASTLIEFISPIREKRKSIKDEEIKEILEEGNKKAREVASETIEIVKEAMGL